MSPPPRASRPAAAAGDPPRFLIFGGTSRSASTALFDHLAAHPRVCPADRKETGALLDPDYVLMWGTGISTAGQSTVRPSDEYFRLYSAWPDPDYVYMEASTDYLYSPGTPQRIRALGDAKVFFVLREPIARLVSWYRFALQQGWLSDHPTLGDYIRRQLSASDPARLPPPLLALDQGRYAPWLRAYLEVFDRGDVHVAFFEELIRDPASIVAAICRFGGLDPDALAGVPFHKRNDSYKVRSTGFDRLVEAARAGARRVARRVPAVEGAKRRLWRRIEPIYRRINTGSFTEALSPSLRRALESYYAQDRDALEDLLGRSVPWQEG